MHKEDIVVDGLVATVGANKNAALETLETICYCKNELGLATVGGLSNISFGLTEPCLCQCSICYYGFTERSDYGHCKSVQ